MVFFSNWNRNITHRHTHTDTHTHTHTHTQNITFLLEVKIWFMLSFRRSRRNMFLRSTEVHNKEHILTYGYLCSLLAVPS